MKYNNAVLLDFHQQAIWLSLELAVKRKKKLEAFFQFILDNTAENPTVSIMGPIPSPMYKKMGQYQMQLIFNGNDRKSLHFSLKQIISILRNNKVCNNIIWSLDLDPINLS
jgi:primosomal protein N'